MMCNVPNAGACFVPSCACGCHKSTEPKVADPIIPSTGEVRADYVRDHTRNFDSYMVGRSLTSEQEFYGAKFDRWLAAHDAEVQAQVVAEEPEERWQYGAQNPDDADGKIIAWSRGFTKRLVERQGHRLFRRTPGVPAGPWVPVKQEGAETDA